jgi:NADPH-dependent curcumin reductase CurA
LIEIGSENLTAELKKHAPNGIDFYFDNVGSTHLEAALEVLNKFGRVSCCGMISTYNEAQPGPANLTRIITKQLHLQGLLVSNFFQDKRIGEFGRDMSAWLASGAIKAEETIVDGFENTPQAFISLFSGKNNGKMLVKL